MACTAARDSLGVPWRTWARAGGRAWAWGCGLHAQGAQGAQGVAACSVGLPLTPTLTRTLTLTLTLTLILILSLSLSLP